MLRDLRSGFDAAFYLERYPDVERSGLDPLAHFLLYGAREGRQPHPWFDIRYYIASNPDVAAAGANPLVHFLRYGWKEGRRANPLFDAVFYAAQFPRLPRGRNPFVDFIERRRTGEKVRGALPFTLPSQSYQVATGVLPSEMQGRPQKTMVYPTVSQTGRPQKTMVCPTDIVIPVYAGLAETRRCIESVLGSACQTPYEMVLINDRTPEPELAGYLREVAAAHGLTLIENSENVGFAGSVNRGLEAHPERDVVLLNSDTEVANDWLDRLVAAAAGERIGTATPFSNHATICSYPKPDVANRLPEGWTVAELDRIFRQANAGHRVRIPTAVGFCMYIRRDCLKDAGAFRAEVFGKGYGEENDFCMRAQYKGWGHVLAADVFVYHAGETSFGGESELRRQAAQETLERLYPEYGRMIAGHMRSDPAKAYRVAATGWRMRHSGRPVILAVSHDLGGGVEQYVRELREVVAGEAEMLLLTPTSYGAVVLRNLDPEDDFNAAWDVELDYAALIELLRYCGVTRLHVQHMWGHVLDLERLRQDLGVPADFSVHDYAVICPQVTLTDASGRYCGEPDAAGCNACIAARPPRPRLDIAAWREKYAPLVRNADRVIAPSQDAAARMRRYFPGANVMAAGHGGTAATQPGRPQKTMVYPTGVAEELVIAVLGVMNVHKGIHRLRACAAAAERGELPLRFVLAGYEDDSQNRLKSVLRQTGPYRNEQLPGLLREMGAHVVWFPAQWPETFSYTLSVCLELGLPVVAPDMGAFAERLAGRSWSWIVPWDWDTGRMLEFFVSVRRDHFLTGIAPAVPKADVSGAADDFYPLKYLRVAGAGVRGSYGRG